MILEQRVQKRDTIVAAHTLTPTVIYRQTWDNSDYNVQNLTVVLLSLNYGISVHIYLYFILFLWC